MRCTTSPPINKEYYFDFSILLVWMILISTTHSNHVLINKMSPIVRYILVVTKYCNIYINNTLKHTSTTHTIHLYIEKPTERPHNTIYPLSNKNPHIHHHPHYNKNSLQPLPLAIHVINKPTPKPIQHIPMQLTNTTTKPQIQYHLHISQPPNQYIIPHPTQITTQSHANNSTHTNHNLHWSLLLHYPHTPQIVKIQTNTSLHVE